MMGAKQRATMLKVQLRDWATIDLSVLEGRALDVTTKRYEAVTLYAEGYPQTYIFEKTGIGRQELSRLLRRCQLVAADGQIFGYRALVLGWNVKGYNRRVQVAASSGDHPAGYAGALGQLFARFPELERYIQGEYLRTRRSSKYQNARITIEQLHGYVIDWLKERGLKEDQWPLNTKSEGIETLRRYCKKLIGPHEQRYLAARAGVHAVSNSSIGTGDQPVFKSRRPFGAVQLDFHKIDSASVIKLINPFGAEITVPLARWYIGLLIEERFEAILGAVVAMEINPSSDSVLETIEMALLPLQKRGATTVIAIGANGNVFANQLLPELAGQGFDIIRMDNGWSNVAIHVIDNIIDVVGAAVNFGPVRAWWTRPVIERVFGQLTRAALQCSPATYGAGPADTRREAPDKTALRLNIELSDLVLALDKVIALHNQTRTEALLMASPIAAMAASIENPSSAFVPAPIPNAGRRDRGGQGVLMYKTSRAVIRGNKAKGVRPYVKVGGWRYTNVVMASDFSLIGNRVKLYSSLRDARVVYATNITTSEDLGRLEPPAKWSDTQLSFRMRSLIQANGRSMRRREKRQLKAHHWAQEAGAVDKPSAQEAVSIAKRALEKSRSGAEQESRMEREDTTTTAEVLQPEVDDDGGLFNLNSLPSDEHIKQGEKND